VTLVVAPRVFNQEQLGTPVANTPRRARDRALVVSPKAAPEDVYQNVTYEATCLCARKVRMHIPAGLSAVPIIFNNAKRRALPPVHEHPLRMQDAPLETQDVL
jgi:hypothetical protein